MARSVSLAQLRLRSRRRADMVTNQFVTDDEVTDVVNDELCELYDLLVEAAPPDYYAAQTPVIYTEPQIISYDLPANFRSLIAVYVQEGGNNGQLRPILPVNEMQRTYYLAPQGIYPVILSYVPSPPVLAEDTDAFDGVSGWDALITARVARRLLQKRKADVSDLMAEIDNKTREIRSSSRRDRGHARTITDVDDADVWFYPNTVRIRGFAIKGDSIELYEPVVPYP